jgi:hypothetical protein
MGAMFSAYWGRVLDDDRSVPTDRPLADLTAELTQMLGDPDPRVRDDLAYSTLAAWTGRGEFDDLLLGLGDGMATGLRRGLGESDTDSVFRRSFSALILGECIARDTERPLVPGGKVLEWGDRIATWILEEQDLRGYVPGKGWAHAVAHGADALGSLGGSPHIGHPELTVLLDVIAERLALPVTQLFSHGEPDRLATATMAMLRRDLAPIETLEPWVARLGETARRRPTDGDPYLASGNAEAFLRALYLQLALGPKPPAVRADLLLLLLDELRTSNPGWLSTASQ